MISLFQGTIGSFYHTTLAITNVNIYRALERLTLAVILDEDYVKIIEPEGISVGTLYFAHGGEHYVALRPMQVRENFVIMY